jgi:aminobenzoyl-glutamate utilization protein B
MAWVEDKGDELSAFHQRIWEYAEPAWRVYQSAKAYVELLRAEGFTVEVGSGGMPTAFCARWGEGRPVLGSFAEYDAVPGNSQQAVPRQAPREGVNHWAPGHTHSYSRLGVGR